MKAVILAGGKGTRLQDLTREIPKPMIKVGSKPVLQHQVELLVSYGFKDITILVNYLKDTIVEYFGDGTTFGANISYYEEKVPLGTVGGIKEIESKLNEDFLVLYGDVMVNMDLQRLVNFHHKKQSKCTLVLHPNDHPYDSDLVETDENDKVVAFHSKPHNDERYYRNLVNAGVYILSPEVIKHISKGQKADFGKDIFPKVYTAIHMFGYNTSEYLKDMGTPDRLEKVNKDYLNWKIEKSNLKHKQKAVYLDRDGVVIEEVDFLHDVNLLELYPFTAESVKKINRSGFLSIVATNQSVVARNLCTMEELQNIHNKMETLLGRERAYLDAIYFCPHHPDKGFPGENVKYKVECDCRKPKSGMLLQAAEKYNIDLSESFMIGDADRDIIAAKNVGVTAIGVMTGKGYRKAKVSPDYLFSNLKEAVDFIIDDPYKDIFSDCKRRFCASMKSPFIIAIGGNTRTGKSCLATYLQKQFEKEKISVLHLKLDNWLADAETRKNAIDVFGRFQKNKIDEDLRKILKKEKVELTEYHHDPARKTSKIQYQWQNEQVIIAEGIVTFDIKAILEKTDLKIYFKINKEELKKRVIQFYKWKGFSNDEAKAIFEERVENEYQLINKHEAFADIIMPALGS